MPKGLEEWVSQLTKRDMPVLGSVIAELNRLTGEEDTQVNQLAEVILRDGNLTTQVLKIANSVRYNPSSSPINTVSRAIVAVGFRGVRAICISVMMIESLLGKEPKAVLLEQMAQSFHAGVQARDLIEGIDDDVGEEVFIAALLYHIGKMALWSTLSPEVMVLEARLASAPDSERMAIEKEVLGCSFKSITRALASQWSLGETLEHALYPTDKPPSKVGAVCLGEEISRVSLKGWESDEFKEVIAKASQFTGEPYVETEKRIRASAESAAQQALIFGVPEIFPLIPAHSSENLESEETVQEEDTSKKPMQPNPEVQLSVLRELTGGASEKMDVNSVFQVVLEGMHRGIGLERVALALNINGQLKAKYVLGEGASEWRETFSFPTNNLMSIFAPTMDQGDIRWLRAIEIDHGVVRIPANEKKVLGGLPAFIGGIMMGKRCIAVFYADRWDLGGELTDEQFQSFRHFTQQAQICLKELATS